MIFGEEIRKEQLRYQATQIFVLMRGMRHGLSEVKEWGYLYLLVSRSTEMPCNCVNGVRNRKAYLEALEVSFARFAFSEQQLNITC